MTEEERQEKERLRQRTKSRKYFRLYLHIRKDRRLIRWLLRGRKRPEGRAVAVRRNLYRLMKECLDREREEDRKRLTERHNRIPPEDSPGDAPQ